MKKSLILLLVSVFVLGSIAFGQADVGRRPILKPRHPITTPIGISESADKTYQKTVYTKGVFPEGVFYEPDLPEFEAAVGVNNPTHKAFSVKVDPHFDRDFPSGSAYQQTVFINSALTVELWDPYGYGTAANPEVPVKIEGGTINTGVLLPTTQNNFTIPDSFSLGFGASHLVGFHWTVDGVQEDVPVLICFGQIDDQGNAIAGSGSVPVWRSASHNYLQYGNVYPTLIRGFRYRFYAFQLNSSPSNPQDYVGAHYGYTDKKILSVNDPRTININIRTDQTWQ